MGRMGIHERAHAENSDADRANRSSCGASGCGAKAIQPEAARRDSQGVGQRGCAPVSAVEPRIQDRGTDPVENWPEPFKGFMGLPIPAPDQCDSRRSGYNKVQPVSQILRDRKMTPNAQATYRRTTDKIAAMYGFKFPCRKCKKQSAPAGRKRNMIAGKQQGWVCAECAKCA